MATAEVRWNPEWIELDAWNPEWLRQLVVCEECGMPDPTTKKRHCMTQYADSKLNKSPVLCAVCAEVYRSHWQACWDEYNASRG